MWITQKTSDEMNKFERNSNKLNEEKVKRSINDTNDNNVNNIIVDISVKFLFNALNFSLS